MAILHRDQSYIKRYNINLVFDFIRRKGPITRKELEDTIGISQTSITRILIFLKELGIIKESVHASGGGLGRRAVNLDIDRESFYSIGVEIDQHTLRICVTDIANEVVALRELNLLTPPAPDALVALVKENLHPMLSAHGIPLSKVLGVGVSCIGVIEPIKGNVVFAPLIGWKNVPIAALMGEALSLPVVVQNDVKTRLISEAHTNVEIKTKSVAFLSVGSGVGASIMHEGQLLIGRNNAAGEIGHMLVKTNGDVCSCGRRGCLQTVIGENAILAAYREKAGADATLEGLFADARDRRPEALQVVDSVCAWLAISLANCVCLFNTEYLVLGGTLINRYPPLFDEAKSRMEKNLYEPASRDLKLIRGSAAPEAVVVGAAVNAQNEFLSNFFRETV